MSSSDSEDDCYGNMAQKLKKIKSALAKEKFDSATNATILDSDEVAKTSGRMSTNFENSTSETITEVLNTTVNSTDNEEFTLDAIIARNSEALIASSSNAKSRGRGRGRASKRKASSVPPDVPEPSEREIRATRRRTSNSTRGRSSPVPEPSTALVDESIPPRVAELVEQIATAVARGRGSARTRGRGSRGRARGRGRSRRELWAIFDDIFGNQLGSNQSSSSRTSNSSPIYPTYSVGNTDEYPDQSDNQQLFSTRPVTEDIEIIEEDPIDDDNEEMSVKVYWQNFEIFKFNIRKYQKLTSIFNYFTAKEGVSNENILLMYNDKILKIDDTPDSINYSIAKFIDGGIVKQNVTQLGKKSSKEEEIGGLKLKFQCQNKKKPFETTLRPEDKLAVAMVKCAEHLETPIELLKFYFDGDLINGKSTPQELELEGGECIDVKIASR